MNTQRTKEDALLDKAVMLAFLSEVHKRAQTIEDRLKLQRLTFLLSYPLFKKRCKGLNYVFFTYRWGPFSNDLYEVESDFEEAGLLVREGRAYSLSESGQFIGHKLYKAIADDNENQFLVTCIQHTVREFASNDPRALMEHVRKMKVQPVGWAEEETLEKLPFHLDLTRVLDPAESRATLALPDEWLEALSHVLSSEKFKMPLRFVS